MSLFQPSVLNKYLSQQDFVLIQKAYKKYVKYFHNAAIQENIRNSIEEQSGRILARIICGYFGLHTKSSSEL